MEIYTLNTSSYIYYQVLSLHTTKGVCLLYPLLEIHYHKVSYFVYQMLLNPSTLHTLSLLYHCLSCLLVMSTIEIHCDLHSNVVFHLHLFLFDNTMLYLLSSVL